MEVRMAQARRRLAELLGRLIDEGKGLRGTRFDAPEVHGWEERCKASLRNVSDRDAQNFANPGNTLRILHESGNDHQRNWEMTLPLKVNVLVAVKEQLELFDEGD